MVFPLAVYWSRFGSFQLSRNFEDWVNFSTYWSPYLVTALTIILAYLSWQNLELMKLKDKPILVIEEYPEYRGEAQPAIPNFFFRIKNLGQGPSMNMRLFIRIRDQLIELDTFLLKKFITNGDKKVETIDGYHYMVHSFSLQPKEDLKINWQFHVIGLALVFEDLHGNTKTILMNQNGISEFDFDTVGIDKSGFKGSVRVFSNGKEYKGERLPKRIFTVDECYNY